MYRSGSRIPAYGQAPYVSGSYPCQPSCAYSCAPGRGYVESGRSEAASPRCLRKIQL